ncbi:MAG: hypothetical protein V1784_04645 [bacterium]
MNGTILHTTNGGEDWKSHNIPNIKVLHSVAFVDTNTGWVVGNVGTILRYFHQ